MRRQDHPEENAFLRLAAGIGLVSWIAVVLAEIGRLSLGALLAAVAALLALWAGLRLGAARRARAQRGRPASGRGSRWAPALGLGVVLLVAAAAFWPPFDSMLWASDATVYLAFGRRLAETGSLVFEDPLLAEIPVEARGELFFNPVPLGVPDRYERFPGGFLIPDLARPEVTGSFSPLFPALLAIAWASFGRAGALQVAPLFALLAVAAVYLVGRRLAGGLAGVLAGLLTAVSLPQVWFARLSMSEAVAGFFVFVGILALLASRDSPRVAAVGGALFGMAMFAKFDLVVVLPVAVTGFVALALCQESETLRQRVKYFAVPFFVLLLHSVVHVLATPTHYRLFVLWKLDALGLSRLFDAVPAGVAPAAAVVLAIAAAGAALVILRGGSSRRWRGSLPATGPAGDDFLRRRWRRGAAVGLAALMAAYGFAYMASSTNRLADTLPWLGWYLSWPVVAVFLAAAAAELRRRDPEGRRSEGLFVLLLVVVAGFHYLYDPHEPVLHIWSIRRLVPIVVPGVLLIASVGVATVVGRAPSRRRAWLAVPAIGLLLALVARPSLVLAGPPPWRGAAELTDRLAGVFPADAVVLVGSDLSGTHLATTLGYGHGLDVMLLRPRHADPASLEDVVLDWLDAGRSVFVVLGEHPVHRAAPRLGLAPVAEMAVELRMLEATRSRRPAAMTEQRQSLRVLRVGRATSKRSVDVGSVAEDVLFEMHGFHDPEREAGLGTFRWTGPAASIGLTGAGERIRILVGGPPEHLAPARISILIDGRRVIEDRAVGAGPAPILVERPVLDAGGHSTLTIESTVFRPSDLGLSEDDRQLGVRVYRIDY